MVYDEWLGQVQTALASINMPFGDWQKVWNFDFRREFEAGNEPIITAEKANRFWWYQQNKAIGQHCKKTVGCWLPDRHHGECHQV